MKVCCNEELVMPKSYSIMNDDEMMYVEGGKAITIPTLREYLNKKKCEIKADWLLRYGYCNNMDKYDIAKEIHAHAVYGYGLLSASASNIPLVSQAIQSICNSGLNGISLEDQKDKWYRVAAYELAWVYNNASV